MYLYADLDLNHFIYIQICLIASNLFTHFRLKLFTALYFDSELFWVLGGLDLDLDNDGLQALAFLLLFFFAMPSCIWHVS